MERDLLKYFTELANNPLFKKSFNDFYAYAQKLGMDAARNYWSLQSDEYKPFSQGTALFEQIIDFYSGLGFVSRRKYEDLLKEKEDLERENRFLKDTIQQLNFKVMTEGGIKMQEAWNTTIEKQMELGKELTKNFFDIFKSTSNK